MTRRKIGDREVRFFSFFKNRHVTWQSPLGPAIGTGIEVVDSYVRGIILSQGDTRRKAIEWTQPLCLSRTYETSVIDARGNSVIF